MIIIICIIIQISPVVKLFSFIQTRPKDTVLLTFSCSLTYQNSLLVAYVTYIHINLFIIFKIQIKFYPLNSK